MNPVLLYNESIDLTLDKLQKRLMLDRKRRDEDDYAYIWIAKVRNSILLNVMKSTIQLTSNNLLVFWGGKLKPVLCV